jgi:hypothetical protein
MLFGGGDQNRTYSPAPNEFDPYGFLFSHHILRCHALARDKRGDSIQIRDTSDPSLAYTQMMKPTFGSFS